MGISPSPEPFEPLKANPKRDPIRDQEVKQKLQSEQNLMLGILSGAIAALLGALLWAFASVLIGVQFRWMAIAMGALVGYAVQKGGKGTKPIFGILGAFFATMSCFIGNLLADIYNISVQESFPFLDIILNVILEPRLIIELIMTTTSFFDFLVYATAALLGYAISLRSLTRRELEYIYHQRQDL